uniref:Uncharacterized protein n=1 Tax=Triticum urartu TaxID=4572 RepID=A0A8R7TMQ7_TRIUA
MPSRRGRVYSSPSAIPEAAAHVAGPGSLEGTFSFFFTFYVFSFLFFFYFCTFVYTLKYSKYILPKNIKKHLKNVEPVFEKC